MHVLSALCSTWIPFSKKGIKIAEHIGALKYSGSHEPRCTDVHTPAFLTEIDSLPGVAARYAAHVLPDPDVAEALTAVLGFDGCIAALCFIANGRNQKFENKAHALAEVGGRIYYGLSANATSWVLLNAAGMYWRAVGNAAEVGTMCDGGCVFIDMFQGYGLLPTGVCALQLGDARHGAGQHGQRGTGRRFHRRRYEAF